MNKHLPDVQLRLALDGELAKNSMNHLQSCPVCQRRLEEMRREVAQLAGRLAFLGDPAPERLHPPSGRLHPQFGHLPSAHSALQEFNHRFNPRKEYPVFKRIFASPVLRIGLAVVVILALVLSVPAARAVADQILNLFRVQQVVVLPLDTTGMEQLTGNSTLVKQLSQLASSSLQNEQKPGEPVTVADASQAGKLAGFTVRLPQGMSPSRISVENSASFSFKLDRAKAQALLDEAGRSDLVLPASIDGEVVSVKIPASVSTAYGNCPDPSTSEPSTFGNGSTGRQYPDCILMAQLPSPSVSAPADMNIAQLAQIGLQFTGMTAEQAAAFTSSVDWTSTLVIPIPKNAATYQSVTVDGVTGTLIQRPADDAPQYALIWVKNGIVYAISSLGTSSQQAIQMANSLP